MGTSRSARGKSPLPNRWAFKHGAYYYRVPPRQTAMWGRQWYRLGVTFEESVEAFHHALRSISSSSVDIEALAANAEESIGKAIIVTGPVVYFLISGGEIVYVGKSKSVLERLSSHRGKDFDSVATVACDADQLDLMEIAYIAALEPCLNVRIKDTGSGDAYFSQRE